MLDPVVMFEMSPEKRLEVMVDGLPCVRNPGNYVTISNVWFGGCSPVERIVFGLCVEAMQTMWQWHRLQNAKWCDEFYTLLLEAGFDPTKRWIPYDRLPGMELQPSYDCDAMHFAYKCNAIVLYWTMVNYHVYTRSVTPPMIANALCRMELPSFGVAVKDATTSIQMFLNVSPPFVLSNMRGPRDWPAITFIAINNLFKVVAEYDGHDLSNVDWRLTVELFRRNNLRWPQQQKAFEDYVRDGLKNRQKIMSVMDLNRVRDSDQDTHLLPSFPKPVLEIISTYLYICAYVIS